MRKDIFSERLGLSCRNQSVDLADGEQAKNGRKDKKKPEPDSNFLLRGKLHVEERVRS